MFIPLIVLFYSGKISFKFYYLGLINGLVQNVSGSLKTGGLRIKYFYGCRILGLAPGISSVLKLNIFNKIIIILNNIKIGIKNDDLVLDKIIELKSNILISYHVNYKFVWKHIPDINSAIQLVHMIYSYIFFFINQILQQRINMLEKTQFNENQKKIEKYIIRLRKLLGKGAYAQVFLGRTISNHQPVAVKVIEKKIFANNYNLKNIQSQIQIMKKIEHKNIVKLLDVYQTTNNMYIITEFCEEGDLQSYLKKKKKLPEKEALFLLKDILDGFKYLVSLGITHRDLKPANILLKNGRCKISDFGFAKNLQNGDSTIMKSIVGTPLYMSPQILNKKSYTNKSDLWSTGLIYYQMLHGYTPWPAQNQIQLINNILTKPIIFDPSISDKSKQFIRKCLRTNQSDRMSWQDAFCHPLINQLTFRKQVQQKENINQNDRDRQRSVSKIKKEVSLTKVTLRQSELIPFENRTPKSKLQKLLENATPKLKRDLSNITINRTKNDLNKTELNLTPREILKKLNNK